MLLHNMLACMQSQYGYSAAVRLACSAAEELKVSSVHMTFNTEEEWRDLGQHGFLQRTGIQYHWYNAGCGHEDDVTSHRCPERAMFASFEEFLMSLKQSKRKAIRQVLACVHLTSSSSSGWQNVELDMCEYKGLQAPDQPLSLAVRIFKHINSMFHRRAEHTSLVFFVPGCDLLLS